MALNCYIAKLKAGYCHPSNLKNYLSNRRAMSLELSSDGIRGSQSSSVTFNCMDLECIEHRYLLIGCSNGLIMLYDVQTGRLDNAPVSSGFGIKCVQWYPLDNRMFTTSSKEKELALWDANEMCPVESFNCKSTIYSHQCSFGSSSSIAVGGSGVVQLVDLKSGNASHELRSHRGSVMAVAWSPRDTSFLASSSTDGEVFLWDVRSAAGPISKFNARNGKAHDGMVNGLSFTKDGLHLITLGSDSMRIWNPIRCTLLPIRYSRVKNNEKRWVKIAVSSNLVFVPNGKSIQRLTLMTGAPVGDLVGHRSTVTCCEYNNAYQELYTCGNDRNVLIWTANHNEHEPNIVSDNWSTDEDDTG